MKTSKDISACITDLEFENYIKDNLSNSEKNYYYLKSAI